MGFLDAIFGRGSANTTTDADDGDDRKYAILLNAGPEDVATGGNAFNYAVELDDAGYEVQVFLDGTATRWPGEFVDDPDRPFNYEWTQIQQRGLLAGACGYCANPFDAVEAYERTSVDLLSDGGEHAPEIAQLADEGYEIMTIG